MTKCRSLVLHWLPLSRMYTTVSIHPCHYHKLRMLTRKGVWEQAEQGNGIRRRDEASNQHMQKYRCFKWSKHSQKRKLWICLQYRDREMYYSFRNVLLPFVPVVHISHLEVLFSFSVFIRNAHCTSINECMRTSKLSDWKYAQIIKYCLVYFCVAFSRVLRN